jgi:hypothetical protein
MTVIEHYEAALKAAFPDGAEGAVFDHWNKARAEAEQERNFCPRCGKRLFSDHIHTCTPPTEAKQEPVAWMYVNKDGECEQIEYGKPFDDPDVTPLYTSPPQRQWVGLTWDDLPDIYVGDKSFLHGAKWAEATLREKNFQHKENT